MMFGVRNIVETFDDEENIIKRGDVVIDVTSTNMGYWLNSILEPSEVEESSVEAVFYTAEIHYGGNGTSPEVHFFHMGDLGCPNID